MAVSTFLTALKIFASICGLFAARAYTFDIRGRKKLESKADMKKRGLHSPDSADALAITFAYRVNEYEGDKGARAESYTKARRTYDPFEYLNRQ